jgi:hypothetical protein
MDSKIPANKIIVTQYSETTGATYSEIYCYYPNRGVIPKIIAFCLNNNIVVTPNEITSSRTTLIARNVQGAIIPNTPITVNLLLSYD